MPRPDTQRHTLFVAALCVAVVAMAAGRTERIDRATLPPAPSGGVAFAAQLGDAAISLSWQ